MLVSRPIDILEDNVEVRDKVRIRDGSKTTLLLPKSGAYRLRIQIDAASDANEVRFHLKEGKGHFAVVGYNFKNGTVFVLRDTDAIADSMPEVYREVRKAPAPAHNGIVTLDIIVDTISIEVFVNDGEAVLSDLVFGAPGANGLSVESSGGDTELRFFQLSSIRAAPIKRYDSDARKVN